MERIEKRAEHYVVIGKDKAYKFGKNLFLLKKKGEWTEWLVINKAGRVIDRELFHEQDWGYLEVMREWATITAKEALWDRRNYGKIKIKGVS